MGWQRKSSQHSVWAEREHFQEISRSDFARGFQDKEWLQKLDYLAVVFHRLIQMNKSLYGPEIFFISNDRILEFKEIESLGKSKSPKEIVKCFNCCLGLKLKEDMSVLKTIQRTAEPHWVYFSLQSKCLTCWGMLSLDFLLTWELDFQSRGRTLSCSLIIHYKSQ